MKLPRPLLKNYYISWNGTFLSPKNLMKPFYTLNKTPLGETGCSSNLYYLLAAQAPRIHFQNCSLKKYMFENCYL